MAYKKIIGWSLFAIGLLIIFWSLYSSFQIFVQGASAPEIFKTIKAEEINPAEGRGNLSLEAIQQQIQQQLVNAFLPLNFLPKILNLISWSLFVGIAIFAGSRISGLGLKLLRDEKS